MYTAIITGITSLVSGYFDRKSAEQQAQIKRAERAQQNESDYDTEAMKQMQFSWKDEWFMVVFTVPLIMAWFDEERAVRWIEFVSRLPEWYQWCLIGMIVASFGLRWYFKKQAPKF